MDVDFDDLISGHELWKLLMTIIILMCSRFLCSSEFASADDTIYFEFCRWVLHIVVNHQRLSSWNPKMVVVLPL
jgi:hypothetical protein